MSWYQGALQDANGGVESGGGWHYVAGGSQHKFRHRSSLVSIAVSVQFSQGEGMFEGKDNVRVLPYFLTILLGGRWVIIPLIGDRPCGHRSFLACWYAVSPSILGFMSTCRDYSYPLTSTGRSHGSVSVDGAFDMNLGGQSTSTTWLCQVTNQIMAINNQ